MRVRTQGVPFFLLFLLGASPLCSEDLILKGATLIDGTGSPPQPGMTVVIRGDKIFSCHERRR
jgi:hypothetical protein